MVTLNELDNICDMDGVWVRLIDGVIACVCDIVQL